MKDVTRIVNLIRGGNRTRSHRKLVAFLKELSAEFHDIPLHSEIRWLSAGKTLTAFFAIRKKIPEFLETAGKIKYDYLEKLQNEEWLCKKQNICQLMSHIEALRKKLRIFEDDLKSNFKVFKSCSEIKNELNSADFKQQ
ncbi:hypothetical protein PR048_005676 [Dryococelus australis]|uniref:Zinc finger BED domain-containing protein 5 n=1 Tax=Dryococelus australis TaxID=614101 RepID=A0ABQ9IB01_9NEOP|nr:hypothetical protein PR048_005676 [Dryococelus australis]